MLYMQFDYCFVSRLLIYCIPLQILTPYRNGQLTDRQRTHNFLHSATRTRVENSFALLKGKERRLKYLHMTNHELVCDHIVASMVLHNFIILEGNDCPVSSIDKPLICFVIVKFIMCLHFSTQGLDAADPPHVNDADFQRLNNEARTLGPLKREYISLVLHPDV